MKIFSRFTVTQGPGARKRAQGFTLIELLIAMGLFAVVGAAALSLFSSDLPVYVRQQNQAGLDISIRSAISQMQMDIVNAGSGYDIGTTTPSNWPVGVSIQNNVSSTACNTPSTYTYGANCFDQIDVITTDKTTPVAHPTDATLESLITNCTATTTGTTYVISPSGTTAAIATAQAAHYVTGDELLLVSSATGQYTTIHLTSNGALATVGALNGVKLVYTANTAPTGTLGSATSTGTYAADPLNLSAHNIGASATKLGTSFCATDFIARLTPVEYLVNTTTNPADPELIRRTVSAGVATDVIIADQLVGFKVGADLYNISDDCPITYYYNSALYPTTASGGVCGSSTDAYNFTRVRGVRISLIARTTPESDPTYVYRNGFDGGPYQVEGVSIVVDPRNLTMNGS